MHAWHNVAITISIAKLVVSIQLTQIIKDCSAIIREPFNREIIEMAKKQTDLGSLSGRVCICCLPHHAVVQLCLSFTE